MRDPLDLLNSLSQALLPIVDFYEEVSEELRLLCPLGNRIEDRRAWDNTHGKPHTVTRLSRKERYEQWNQKRHKEKKKLYDDVFRQLMAYYNGENPINPINKAIKVALARTGRSYSKTAMWKLRKDMKRRLDEAGIDYKGKSVTSSKILQAFHHINNKVLKHYRLGGNMSLNGIINAAIKTEGYIISKNEKTKLKNMIIHNLEQLGIIRNPACQSGSEIFPKGSQRSIIINNKYVSINTVNRGKRIKSAKELWALVNAIMKGRPPWYPFGQKTSRNDEDWVTLKSLHYDNCKVVFNPKLLAWPIYDLLQLGATVKQIVTEYGILLHHYHGVAVDAGISVWQPTKLANDLRVNVCQKYLGL